MVNTILDLRARTVEKGVVCRLCMNYDEDSLNIFASNSRNGMTLWNVIRDLLSLEVAEGDGLPDTVCCQCMRKLMEFSEFRGMCIKSANELRRIAQESGLKVHIKQEVNSSESLDEDDTCRGENLGADEPRDRPASDALCAPDEIGVKEEASQKETVASEDSCRGENLSKDASRESAAYYVICELGNEGDGSSIARRIPKTSRTSLNNLRVKCLGKNTVRLVGKTSHDGSPLGHSLKYDSIDQCQQMESGTVTEEEIFQPKDYSMYSSTFNDWKHTEEGNDKKTSDSQLKPPCDWTEYICNYCGFKCSDKNALCMHISSHVFSSRTFERPDKNISERGITLKRAKIPEGSKAFVCQTCGREFAQRYSLMRHLVIHTGLKPFVCEMCGEAFNRKSTLVTHMVIHTGKKPYKCEVCGKGFNQKRTLATHSVIHCDSKPFTCDDCGKGFSRRNHLSRHSVIHSGLKQFRCEACGKGFNQKSDLSRHSVVHTGLKMFKCETCAKDFNQRSDLLVHEVIHSGLKPFKCEICEKGFNRKSNLKMHSLTHKGLKPFRCGTCGKEYYQKSHLLRHSVLHAGPAIQG